MQLPDFVKTQIDFLLEKLPLSDLKKASTSLSSHYREDRQNKKELASLSYDQKLAYLLVRLPATYAVIVDILSRIEGFEPYSLLDVGAGPGTASLAAFKLFPSLKQGLLLEKDPEFIQLGKQFIQGLEEIEQKWKQIDLNQVEEFSPHDLVIASYSLGELEEKERLKVLSRLWEATKGVLVLIEPGTCFGFSQINQMRECLISKQANLILPCPHFNRCPLVGSSDWCHFSARVERTSFHRQMKNANLNYEDEKFSYVVFSRGAQKRCLSRIIRHPFRGSGFVKFKLCSIGGMEEKTITRKDKEQFRLAKKIKWGDFYLN